MMTTINEWILPPDVLKDRSTSHGPALAKCGYYLYMAWKGSISNGKDDEWIWFSQFDGTKWTEPKPGPGMTSCGPALAEYKGKLYMAWKGSIKGSSNGTNDERTWFSMYDGTAWSPQQVAKAEDGRVLETSHRPALAAYKDKLFMVWKRKGSDSTICYSSYDVSKNLWSAETAVPGAGTSHGPALAVYCGTGKASDERLYMTWKRPGADEQIWFSVFDGSRWTPQQITSNDRRTSCVPAMASYSKYWENTKSFDPCYKDILMVWKGSSKGYNSGNDTRLWQSTWFKLSTNPQPSPETCEGWSGQRLCSASIKTSDTPALAEFNSKLYMAWKQESGYGIYFSQLEAGSDNYIRNIFGTTVDATSLYEKSRLGNPVVRPEDLVALRVETQNLKIVTGLTSIITIDKVFADLIKQKTKQDAIIALLDSPIKFESTKPVQKPEIKPPTQFFAKLFFNLFYFLEAIFILIKNLLHSETDKNLKEIADKLRANNIDMVFCQQGIDDKVLQFLSKEGFMVAENVSAAEMENLAGITGATIISNLDKLTKNDLGVARLAEDLKTGGGNKIIVEYFKKPHLQKNGTGPAYIILHFPPQSFAEQTFFQENKTDIADPELKEGDKPKHTPTNGTEQCEPPLDARISHESRLVFIVPDNMLPIEYSLESVLEACKKLELKVTAAADAQIAIKPKPELPDATTTSIEMPWRLILSPNSKGRWRHKTKLDPSAKTNELWHSRLVTPLNNKEIEPPYPDENRTTRAIWALSGVGKEIANKNEDGSLPLPMQSDWPNSDNLPTTTPVNPFRTTLDNFDRYQIAHLTSNFSVDYKPNPLETNMMMLSSLGGWLDSRGAWDPPGLSVEQWVHRATMGRDHYVRVVYRGFLFPFGHRASLIKVSERKFNKTKTGDHAAYLHQRLYLIICEKERFFNDDALFCAAVQDNGSSLARKFPFKSVKLLTETTPDLSPPDQNLSIVRKGDQQTGEIQGQKMFWPHVNNQRFCFQCVAADLDGRQVFFELPMIFVDNTKALPRKKDGEKLVPNFEYAEECAQIAITAFAKKGLYYNTPDLNLQRVALAKSVKSGDTSVQVQNMTFGGFAQLNDSIKKFSKDLTRPVWVPQVEQIGARIESIANLSGAQGTHKLTFNEKYLRNGFNTNNKGEVFVDVLAGGPNIDFSSQGDKSGGFIQPNLSPAALSRFAGPVMGDLDAVNSFIGGTMKAGAGFSTETPGLPLPLIFGCIPLGALIKSAAVENLECIPKFISEVSSKLESFINDMLRLKAFVSDIPDQSANIAKAALKVFKETLNDLDDQAKAYNPTQLGQIRSEMTNLWKDNGLIDKIIAEIKIKSGTNTEPPSFQGKLSALGSITTALDVAGTLKSHSENTSLPAGFNQSLRNAVIKLTALLNQIKQLDDLTKEGNALWKALNVFFGSTNPSEILNKFNTDNLGKLKDAIKDFKIELKKADLLDGAPRNILLSALTAVEDYLENIGQLVELLTGDELTVRFDWNPEIMSWPDADTPLFRANDKKGLLVAVEAKVKKNGLSNPKIGVNCSLKHFDLVLLPGANFIELNFEKIEFSVDSAAKMNVDVLLSDLKFIGVLSFVETLRDLIPLDGFSDPPYLDITSKGIDAGFDVSLPSICIGVLNIANISLGAGFTVPFIGQPVSVRFNFCRREQPFLLTVYGLGGGGFLGITIDPHGVQIFEAALEFGAAVSIDFGVASGGVHIMAGFYYRMEKGEASLTGYFRLGGYVRVLGLISASLELYLGLTYEPGSGKCVGRAQLTIEVSVLFFSTSVTISCERKFAGSNGDPTIRQMLGPDTIQVKKYFELTVDEEPTLEHELQWIDENPEELYAWREYFEAFV